MPFNPLLFFHIPVQLISVIRQECSLHWFSNVLINQIFSPGLQQVLIIIAVIQGHGTEQS